MAKHEFNNRDLEAYQSANAYREEAERRHHRKEEIARKEADKKRRDQEYAIEKGMIERRKRKAIRDDPVLGERQKASIGSDFVVGMAKMIASTAAEASYNKALMEAQKNYKDDYTAAMSEQSISKRAQEIEEYQKRTLASYSTSVEDTRRNLEATQQASYVEYQDAKKDAQQAINAANDEYERREREADKTLRSIESKYQQEVDAIEKAKENAAQDRDANIEYWQNKRDGAVQQHEEAYKRQVESINQAYSGDEREKMLASAKEEHESRLKSTQEYFDGQADAELTKYAMAIDKCNADAQLALENKNARIDRCNDALAELGEKRDEVVSHHNDIIRAAQSQYVDAVREAKSSAQDAVVARDALQGAIAASNSSQLAASNISHQFDAYSVIVGAEKAGSGAERFMASINNSHAKIGNDLACVFGSKEEVDLLNKVNADKAAKAEAIRNGVEAPLPLATKEEYAAAEKIEKKYAGDIGSEKGLNGSIQTLNNALNALNEKQNMVSVQIAEKNKEIAALAGQIASTQARIDRIAADQKLLAIGRNADGTKLTAEQRGQIEARIQANGGMAENRRQLAALMTQKNAAMNAILGLEGQVNGNAALINGTKIHIAQLEKNGKAILHAKDRSALLGKKGFDQMYKSATIIQKQFNGATLKGNVFYEAKEKRLRKMKQMGQRYELTLKYTQKVVRIMQKGTNFMKNAVGKGFKFIGKHTGLGRAMTARYQAMTSKLMQGGFGNGIKKTSAALQKGKTAAGKVAGKAVMLPLNILKAPEKRMQNKRRRAEQAFRTTKTMTGRVTGYVGRQVSKPINAVKRSVGNKIRSSPLYQKTADKVNLAKERAKERAKNFRKKLGKPFEKAKASAAKFFASITSAISSAASAVLSFVSSIIGFASVFLAIIIIAIIAVSLLFSILNAIFGFFEKLTTYSQSLVATEKNSDFIANQAVNYRNEELNIFELFVNAQSDKSAIKVSKSPIYYSLYYKESTGEKILHWFGIKTDDDRKLRRENSDAKNMWENDIIKAKGALVFRSTDGTVGEFVHAWKGGKYDNIRVAYYTADDLIIDANGEYKIRDGAAASDYEISNAKDAMAMVDALYTKKSEHMQKMEVLSYLGVGDYQLGDVNDKDPANIKDNLFWATHKIIYRSGNKDSDYYFCPTEKVGEDHYIAVGCTEGHYDEYEYTYQKPVTKERESCLGHYHTPIKKNPFNFSLSGICDDFRTEHRDIDGKTVTMDVCNGHAHETHLDEYGNYRVDENCDNKRTEEFDDKEEVSGVFQVCRGHIDLDVAIAVTLLSDDGKMFEAARGIPGPNADKMWLSKFGIISYDAENDVWGLGPVRHNPYSPANDWAEGSEFRDLAKVKAENDARYVYEEGKDIQNVLELRHYNTSKDGGMISLTKSSDNALLYAVFVGNQKYYVDALVSGEQKNLIYYTYKDGSYGPETDYVSFMASPSEESFGAITGKRQ